jgi:pSer/pThr/pTyr-binding forkhead associated (FHA) protein
MYRVRIAWNTCTTRNRGDRIGPMDPSDAGGDTARSVRILKKLGQGGVGSVYLGRAASVRITLTVTEGPHQGKVFTFGEHDTFIVGRSARAQLQLSLNDQYFSRHHFLVEVNPPRCRLMDLGSRNGTFVNGTRTTTADLHDGDIIKAGRTVLRASIEPMAGNDVPTEAFARAPSTPLAGSKTDVEAYATVYPEGETSGRGTATEPIILTEADVVQDGVSTVPLHAAPAAPSGHQAVAACPACGGPVFADSRTAASGPGPSLCVACEAAAGTQRQRVAGYRVIRELGRGAMGVVHLAVRVADGGLVALKTITPTAAASQHDIKRFLREARILRQLEHPHIVAFREMGEAQGSFFFTMDYVRGIDAAKLLKRHQGGMPIGRAVELACQLLGALQYAHGRKFVHRDLKPSNLLVTEGYDAAGKTRDVVKLADFGLARVYQSATFSGLTMQGDYGGTYPFMPPEQITHFRESQPPNDLYAAGATLYNLLTGRYVYDFPPTIERSVAMLLQDDPVPIRTRRKDIPPALAKAVHRALAREPGDRHENARAMAEAIAPFRSMQ